jgi:hypothetical protein
MLTTRLHLVNRRSKPEALSQHPPYNIQSVVLYHKANFIFSSLKWGKTVHRKRNRKMRIYLVLRDPSYPSLQILARLPKFRIRKTLMQNMAHFVCTLRLPRFYSIRPEEHDGGCREWVCLQTTSSTNASSITLHTHTHWNHLSRKATTNFITITKIRWVAT